MASIGSIEAVGGLDVTGRFARWAAERCRALRLAAFPARRAIGTSFRA